MRKLRSCKAPPVNSCTCHAEKAAELPSRLGLRDGLSTSTRNHGEQSEQCGPHSEGCQYIQFWFSSGQTQAFFQVNKLKQPNIVLIGLSSSPLLSTQAGKPSVNPPPEKCVSKFYYKQIFPPLRITNTEQHQQAVNGMSSVYNDLTDKKRDKIKSREFRKHLQVFALLHPMNVFKNTHHVRKTAGL